MLRILPFTRYLTWAWIIVLGALIITPGGILCIRCGVPIDALGYIGDRAVTVLGVGGIVLGVFGLASSVMERVRPRSSRNLTAASP